MNNRQLEAGSAWIVAGLLIWLGLAVAIGAAGMLRNLRPQTIPSVVALLTAIVLVICWRVPAARTAAMSLDVRYILGFHLVRFFAGVLFLIEASDGRLAAAFAYPAAVGDIAVAVFALLLFRIVIRPSGTLFLVIWNTAGLLDILFVVSTALRVGLRDRSGMAPLRELPLSVLPTFVVPLIIVSHLILFVRLARRIT